jgi:hypothetical protein
MARSSEYLANWMLAMGGLLVVACSGSSSLGGGGGEAAVGGASLDTGGSSAIVGVGGVSNGGQLSATGGAVSSGGSVGVAGGSAGTGGSTSVYQPCAGKSCGSVCTACAPNDPNCVETADIKHCNPAGQCASGSFLCVALATGGSPSTGGAPATGGTKSVGGSSAVTCGTATCGAGEYCCNASCSLCTPLNVGCIQSVCTGTGGSPSTGGASGAGGATSIAGLHSSCVNNTCPAGSGLTPVTYYGVAGTSGPQFCNCEIPCGTSATTSATCPGNMRCISIHDGPGDVCVFTDASGNAIWP